MIFPGSEQIFWGEHTDTSLESLLIAGGVPKESIHIMDFGETESTNGGLSQMQGILLEDHIEIA